MNAHICLQASFDRYDLSKTKGWKHDVHSIVRDWLWTFGLYCGITRFYLWDLVPAVYISNAELFDDNIVPVNSTVSDLESGTIVLGHDGDSVPLSMPARILDPAQFKRTLFQAWTTVLA
jgi:hypothetical protein